MYDYTDVVFVKNLLQLQDNLLCVEDHVKVKEIVEKFKLTDFAGMLKYSHCSNPVHLMHS